jgi:hypothetical protein
MINGVEYAWEDLQVVMLGRPVIGITEVSYKVMREKRNIWGRGNKPVARGRGPKNYEGKIKLLQSELEALQRGLAKGSDPTDIRPFQVVCAYQIEPGGIVTTDIWEDVEILEFEKAMKTTDLNMEIELPVIIGEIRYNS